MNRILTLAITFVVLGIAIGGCSNKDDASSTAKNTTAQNGVVYNEAGIAIGGVEPAPSGGVPLNIDNILASVDKAVVISTDGGDTFRVPTPEDPEWADYLEYRRHFRSALDNTDGFAVAYDPDWRAAVAGVREAPEPGLKLSDTFPSIHELADAVLTLTAAEDYQGLIDLAIRKEEFEIICWPSFPQSRPYMRVPWEEAWGFQYANLLGGSREGGRQVDQRHLEIVSIATGEVQDYEWFKIHARIVIEAREVGTEDIVTLTYLHSIIEQDGEFKVFVYKD